MGTVQRQRIPAGQRDPLIACFIFAAKSSEDPRGSIPSQISDCRGQIDRLGGRVLSAEPFFDEAKSAYNANRGDGLARAKAAALGAARERGTAELWVQHSDRLARGDGITADHLIEVWIALRKDGVRLRSVQDDDNLDDMIRVVLIGERNHEDSRRKSLATRAGKRRRAEAKKALGGPVNDGYRLVEEKNEDGSARTKRDGRLVRRRELDPTRAAVIRCLFDLVESGATLGDVARRFNSDGLRTRTGKRWTARAVRGIVTNAFYAGHVVAYGEVWEGEHEPLIGPARWSAIQQSLRRMDAAAAQRRKGGRTPAEAYLLRGIARCFECDEAMYTRRFAAGRAYICGNVRMATGICDAPKIDAEMAERQVLHWLDDLIPHVEDWIDERSHERGDERALLQRSVRDGWQRLAELQRERDAFRDDYRRRLLAQDQRKADLALEEVERMHLEIAAQEQAAARAEARLSEWETPPSAVDAALDFYHRVSDVISGRTRTASSFDHLQAALNGLLAGVWLSRDDDGRVRGIAELRPDEPSGLTPLPLGFVAPEALPDMPQPPWLAAAKPDATRWCTRSP